MALDTISPDLDGAELRIGVVQARFNSWAGEALLEACLRELANLGVDEDDITVLTVPGALEVPLTLATLASNGDFDALIALGCVIRGETYHFEIVAQQSAAGVARVALDHRLPVVNAILTTENDEQARSRVLEKGTEAARVAVEMANLLWALEEDGSEVADE
ncbi:MAG TPA: 6,7-dimethyl-8-ribityllumazine synthase [Burkholderiaceae bacterium]|nr:6,7-dimethyl-8-ribityllumazine synthase [Burkholderiaceae bacterium]